MQCEFKRHPGRTCLVSASIVSAGSGHVPARFPRCVNKKQQSVNPPRQSAVHSHVASTALTLSRLACAAPRGGLPPTELASCRHLHPLQKWRNGVGRMSVVQACVARETHEE